MNEFLGNFFISPYLRFMIIDYAFSDIQEILSYQLKYDHIERLRNNVTSLSKECAQQVFEYLIHHGRSKSLRLLFELECKPVGPNNPAMRHLVLRMMNVSSHILSSHEKFYTGMTILFEKAILLGKVTIVKILCHYRKIHNLIIDGKKILDTIFSIRSIKMFILMIDNLDWYCGTHDSDFNLYACKMDSICMANYLLNKRDEYGHIPAPKSIIINAVDLKSTKIIKWLGKHYMPAIKSILESNLETNYMNTYSFNLFKHTLENYGIKCSPELSQS